ncbi:MAG TPA: choice-of-anchor Q domain-containing protein [Candidatus Baltobacteraceae bacterium]
MSASAVRKPQGASPQTISSGTQSITVSVNGGTPQIFNVTSCSGSPNLTCQLSVGATYGADSFLILTWSGPNGTGTALNAAAVTINVSASGPNTASATAGNLLTITSSADTSGPSNSCAGGTTTCTLREAVAEASTTSGVFTALMFSGVSSITVTSPITLSGQNMIVLGPGASAANAAGVGAPSASSGVTISGGGTSQIFYVNSGSSLLVDGVTVSGGVTSDNDGGAIENYGQLAIVNSIFSNNGSAGVVYGGAVYDEGTAPATIVYSTFTNNRGEYYGGAIYEDAGASISHDLFNGNVAFDGSSYGTGGAIYADDDLFVSNSTFTANVAGSTSVSNVSGYGGAIYIDDTNNAPTITASTFGGSSASAGNFAGGPGATAEGEGGAVYNDGDNPITLNGNTFSNNTVKGGEDASGGAISDYEGVSSTGDTFTNNTADATAAMTGCEMYAYGGAVYTDEPSTWTTATFTGNQALGTLNGSANVYGGALFDYYGGGITVTGSTFQNNTANGGVYEAYGGGLAVDDYYGVATLTNDKFTGNTATAQSGSAFGGGVFVEYAYITFSGLTFTNNTASITGTTTDNEAYGGGLEFAYGDEAELDSIARRAPPAMVARHAKDASRQAKHVARVFTHTQALTLAHMNKKSKHASLAYSRRTAPGSTRRAQIVSVASAMSNTSFSGNTATAGTQGYAFGGGADFSGSPVITATTLSGNSATTTIANTDGYAAGGGFSNGSYGGCASMSFTGTVSGNSATNGGGGIYNVCNQFTLTQSTVSGNKVTAVAYAGDGGGGIYSDCESVAIGQTTINGNSVAGTVAHSGGGGFLNYQGDVTITNSTITANTSSVDGGGIENTYNAETDLVNVTIYQNTATGNGGGISNDDAGSGSAYVYAANSIIAGDTASASGSDIWNLDTFYSYGYNVVQQSSNYGSGSSNAPQTGDIIGQSPALASLASNGGPTSTIADTSSSPGKALIPFASSECNGFSGTNVDQRGFSRGANNMCDVGAYELSGTATTQQAAIVRHSRNSKNLQRSH